MYTWTWLDVYTWLDVVHVDMARRCTHGHNVLGFFVDCCIEP